MEITFVKKYLCVNVFKYIIPKVYVMFCMQDFE